MNPTLSVVVPCFNEEGSLAELHQRTAGVCRQVVGEDFELVLVNDGSNDRTWSLMAEACARDARVVAINLSRNYGHQVALTAGLQFCRGQRILILDADLQDPPELLPAMMARMDEGADVVFGQRVQRRGETWFKRATAHLFYRLLERIVDIPIPPDTGDFRLMSRRSLDVLNSMPEQHRFVRGMVSWIGLRQVAVPYHRDERYAGTSHYPLSKMLHFAFDAITGFSVRPLRLAAYFGFVFGALALVLLAYVLLAWFRGNVVSGWTSLAAIMLTLGSVQLIVAGVMGEYLGRLFIESKRRPLFVVQEVLSAAQPKLEAVPIRLHGSGKEPNP